MKHFLQCLFGTAVAIAAALMWKYWKADGTVMTLIGIIGLFISAASFTRTPQ